MLDNPSRLRDPRWPVPLSRGWNRGTDAIMKLRGQMMRERGITPARLGIEFCTIHLDTDDGVQLKAWLTTPKTPRPDGLGVVLHHHYGGQKATVMAWIRLFDRLGLRCLAFDARGHAGSPPNDAPDSFPRRAADVRAAHRALLAHGAHRVIGFGQSQGAAALVMALADEERVAGLILDSGPAPAMELAAWGLSGAMLRGADPGTWRTRALLSARILPGTEPPRYLATLWRGLAKLRGLPLLWIHGEADRVIERRWSGIWFRALRGARWRALRIPECDHIQAIRRDPEGVRRSVEALLEGL